MARRSTAQTLISRALTGDEKSRAELERIATSSPAACPNGSAAAIAGSRFDRAASARFNRSSPRPDSAGDQSPLPSLRFKDTSPCHALQAAELTMISTPQLRIWNAPMPTRQRRRPEGQRCEKQAAEAPGEAYKRMYADEASQHRETEQQFTERARVAKEGYLLVDTSDADFMLEHQA